jgi:hypothetical protein
MAYCHNYRDMKKMRPDGASNMLDDNITKAVSAHRNPDFWDKYRNEPDRYAYIRRWSSVIRREARKRGLL